jgi:hypothetical protein
LPPITHWPDCMLENLKDGSRKISRKTPAFFSTLPYLSCYVNSI